jgi:RNA polymerase sigma-70 factor (ECF subfamily)
MMRAVVNLEQSDQGTALLAMYDRALPQVFGYLRTRVGTETVAEDLTAETFLAAVQAIDRKGVPDLTVAWLIGVARHKLVDHWRREAREARNLRALPDESVAPDDLDERFERARTREVLEELGAHHRAALTLRYLDGLSVPEVAQHLDRTVHATEALLVRARNAFRVAYARGESDDD